MVKTTHRTRAFKKLFVLSLLACSICFGSLGCDSLSSLQDDVYQQYRDLGTPFIKAIDPPSGSIGTKITIVGELFGAEQGTGKVYFYAAADGGAVSASVESWTATQIECRVPATAVTDQKVGVEILRGDGVKSPYLVGFLVTAQQ